MKGLEILVMHNQEEEEEIENDVYHVGVTKCSDACEWIRSADLRLSRLKG